MTPLEKSGYGVVRVDRSKAWRGLVKELVIALTVALAIIGAGTVIFQLFGAS